jgi:hypothetical protein
VDREWVHHQSYKSDEVEDYPVEASLKCGDCSPRILASKDGGPDYLAVITKVRQGKDELRPDKGIPILPNLTPALSSSYLHHATYVSPITCHGMHSEETP